MAKDSAIQPDGVVMIKVFIELTNACNFSCSFCPESIMTRKKGFMKKDMAFRLMKEIKDENIGDTVLFHLMGEPLLHPDFLSICKEANRLGLKINLITNGSLLTEKMIDGMLKIEFNRIDISLQTIGAEDFGHRHAKMTYAAYMERIERLIIRNAETGMRLPIYIPIFNTAMSGLFGLKKEMMMNSRDDIVAELARWYDFCRKVEGITGKQLIKTDPEAISRINLLRGFSVEMMENLHIESRRLEPWGDINTRGEKTYPALFGGCEALRTHVGVLWNGDVTICCKDYDGKCKIGNVEGRSLKSVLTSKAAERVVHDFNKCKLPFYYCRICRGGTNVQTWVINQCGSVAFHKFKLSVA